ncbi:hypothetical protein F5148DRAFT_1194516 [Russula earlei]|uniref:Uncharacterized protein n=1 Tax=Russula earlei TaxID=71964 RepID=A0ACC0UBM1_9AGAM|nr:hypothetical protein F5148DRAFT_1194516 [Russula earlei]
MRPPRAGITGVMHAPPHHHHESQTTCSLHLAGLSQSQAGGPPIGEYTRKAQVIPPPPTTKALLLPETSTPNTRTLHSHHSHHHHLCFQRTTEWATNQAPPAPRRLRPSHPGRRVCHRGLILRPRAMRSPLCEGSHLSPWPSPQRLPLFRPRRRALPSRGCPLSGRKPKNRMSARSCPVSSKDPLMDSRPSARTGQLLERPWNVRSVPCVTAQRISRGRRWNVVRSSARSRKKHGWGANAT